MSARARRRVYVRDDEASRSGWWVELRWAAGQLARGEGLRSVWRAWSLIGHR